MTRKIKDVMHAGVEAHSPDTPIATIAKTMKEKDVGAVAILDGPKLVGIVTDRDITVRAIADGRDVSGFTAKDVMTRDVASCHDTDTAAAAEKLMVSRGVRRIPVLDQGNRIVGMVSLGDISHAVPPEEAGRLMRSVSAHHA